MPRYLIESSHTEEECLRALDEVLAQGTAQLASYDFGCAAGMHTCYAIVEVENEAAARNRVPSFLKSRARIIGLNKFTPEQIRSFHGS